MTGLTALGDLGLLFSGSGEGPGGADSLLGERENGREREEDDVLSIHKGVLDCRPEFFDGWRRRGPTREADSSNGRRRFDTRDSVPSRRGRGADWNWDAAN